MDGVSRKELDAIVGRINRILGMPDTPYVMNIVTGKYENQGGNYHLDEMYGGWSLCRMAWGGSGTTTIIGRGTKREIRDRMYAFIEGINAARAVS